MTRIVAGVTIGHIEQYCPENELFSSYLEWVKQFFIANDIKDERKKATFLSLIGSQTYSLLKNLVSPIIPKDKSYLELVSALEKHYESIPLIIAERFHLHRRSQAVGESMNEYMAEVRHLTTHCKFGGFLDEALFGGFLDEALRCFGTNVFLLWGKLLNSLLKWRQQRRIQSLWRGQKLL